jgi:MYXO-CTERM domain-containing protein
VLAAAVACLLLAAGPARAASSDGGSDAGAATDGGKAGVGIDTCSCDHAVAALVCGSDGKTYYNNCVALVCAGLSSITAGPCHADDTPLMCTDIVGADGGLPHCVIPPGCAVAARRAPGSPPATAWLPFLVLLGLGAARVLSRR